VYAIKSQIFFLADISFLEDHLRFGYIYFLLANVFHEGRSSLIRAVLHSGKYGIL